MASQKLVAELRKWAKIFLVESVADDELTIEDMLTWQAADRIEALEAMIGDAQCARRMKSIGCTGGGNPLIYYDSQLVGEALIGEGPNSQKLMERK